MLDGQSIAIIVLAAGQGRRMGERPKLLLPLHGGEPIIRRTVRNALALRPGELVVVIQPNQPSMLEALSGLPARCVPNPRHSEGMATSIAAGVEALGEDAQAVLVILGDMPLIAHAVIEGLLSAYKRERKPVTIPRYGGEIGPPTLFDRRVFPDLLQLTGEAGGRQLLKKYPDRVCIVPFGESERPGDIDTSEDYEAAKMTEKPKMTIEEINRLEQDEFVAKLGFLFEGSPWIAEHAWHARPFDNPANLHEALCRVMYSARPDRKVALIAAHPDLVSKAALAGTLTPESAGEQASAGLDSLTGEETATFNHLNRLYRDKFGFPFVICARQNKKESILSGFGARLRNSREEEIETALGEIAKIARLRLLDITRQDNW